MNSDRIEEILHGHEARLLELEGASSSKIGERLEKLELKTKTLKLEAKVMKGEIRKLTSKVEKLEKYTSWLKKQRPFNPPNKLGRPRKKVQL